MYMYVYYVYYVYINISKSYIEKTSGLNIIIIINENEIYR